MVQFQYLFNCAIEIYTGHITAQVDVLADVHRRAKLSAEPYLQQVCFYSPNKEKADFDVLQASVVLGAVHEFIRAKQQSASVFLIYSFFQ